MPHPSPLRSLFAGMLPAGRPFDFPAALSERDPEEAAVVERLISELHRVKGELIDSATIDAEEAIPETVIFELARIGLLGLTIPREYGGAGLSHAAYARVAEEVAIVDPSVAVLLAVHNGLAARAIVLFGSDDQKQRYLPRLARGETLGAYALTEPEAGSDARNLHTRAEPEEDGSGWRLSGRKIWIANGHRAGVIVTFAQAPVERDGERVWRPTAFLVRPDMAGFRVLGTVRKLGLRGSTQAELEFRAMRVPADACLGTPGRGFAVAMTALHTGRLALAAGATAAAKQTLREMAGYAERREQFGRPLGGFEITQRKLAEIASDIYAADALVALVAALADDPAADHALEAAVAKLFASELAWHAADEMVQVAGGRGFLKPFPYERMLRDARLGRMFEGTNEVLRLFLALSAIEQPAMRRHDVRDAIREPLHRLGVLGRPTIATPRKRIATTRQDGAAPPTAFAGHGARIAPALAGAHADAERRAAELRTAVEYAVATHGAAIVERQMVLERLADMAIALLTSVAALARTQRLIETDGDEAAHSAVEMCLLHCAHAARRFGAARDALDAPDDALVRAVASAVRAERGYPVSEPILPARPIAEKAEGVRRFSGPGRTSASVERPTDASAAAGELPAPNAGSAPVARTGRSDR